MRTVTGASIPAGVIKAAGGELVDLGGKPTAEGTSIVSYDLEQLVASGDKIDYYLAQRGAMNATISVESLKQRPGYDTLPAIQSGRAFVIQEELISRPTFALLEGARALSGFWRESK